jgi:hypothetical protein
MLLLAWVGETLVEVSCWTLGGPGECAIRMGRHSIVLAALDGGQCGKLAELTAHTGYSGVIGPDLTARWFTDRARQLGLQFLAPVPQRIYSISHNPTYPGASGNARPVTMGDASLLADWLMAFHWEADPQDPVPTREELERTAGEDRFLFWIDNGRPVSMPGIVRRLKNSAAITGVYTPPELRGAAMPDRLPPLRSSAYTRRDTKSLAFTRTSETQPRTAAIQKSGSRRCAVLSTLPECRSVSRSAGLNQTAITVYFAALVKGMSLTVRRE